MRRQAGDGGSGTEVLRARRDPPARVGTVRVEDDGDAAQAIVDFLVSRGSWCERPGLRRTPWRPAPEGLARACSPRRLARGRRRRRPSLVGGDAVDALAVRSRRAFGADHGPRGRRRSPSDPPLPQPRVDVMAERGAPGWLRHRAVLQLGLGGRRRRRPGRPARGRPELGPGRHRARSTAVRSAKRLALGDAVLVDVGWRSPTRDRASSGRAPSTRSPMHVPRARTCNDVAVDLEGALDGGHHGRAPVPARRGPVGGRRRGDRGRRHGPRGGRALRPGRGAGRRARRRGRGHARRRLCRLVPVLGPDRPDRQDRLAQALRGARDLGGDPAQGGHAELQGDRGDQQGSPARRSSSSATWPWSATCTRSSRS